MDEPVSQLGDTCSTYLCPHIPVAVHKDAGEQPLHHVLQLILVALQGPSLGNQLLQLGLPCFCTLHQLTLTLSLNLALYRGEEKYQALLEGGAPAHLGVVQDVIDIVGNIDQSAQQFHT